MSTDHAERPVRFYFPALATAGDIATLPAAEAHHTARVRRLAVGVAVELFDGQGTLANARILRVRQPSGEVEVALAGRRVVPALRPSIRLACALPKGDRQAVMWGMAAQLGIATLTPLHCERSVSTPGAGARRAGY